MVDIDEDLWSDKCRPFLSLGERSFVQHQLSTSSDWNAKLAIAFRMPIFRQEDLWQREIEATYQHPGPASVSVLHWAS